ncbi:uncharacterized protein LOC144363033 [Saccoglossus kowalevskii]
MLDDPPEVRYNTDNVTIELRIENSLSGRLGASYGTVQRPRDVSHPWKSSRLKFVATFVASVRHRYVRYRRCNKIFAGIWFGFKKPECKTFLQPFAVSLKELFTTGYRRQSSQKQINEGENVGEALENIFDATFSPFGKATDKYLCHVCYGLLEKTRKKKKESNVAENELMKRTVEGTYISRKRKRCVNSPSSTPRRLKKSKDFKEHILKKSAKKITFVKKAVMAIQRHDYESAVNILFRSSVRARRQVLNVVRNKVRFIYDKPNDVSMSWQFPKD